MRNRVREVRNVRASDLRANPRNWRLHPDEQRSALSAMLDEIGFVGTLIARETADGTLEDRCVYLDTRFYFDCGRVFSGRGGAVGMITAEVFERTSRAIRRRWGRHVSFKAPGFQKQRDVPAVRIDVRRTNKAAQR